MNERGGGGPGYFYNRTQNFTRSAMGSNNINNKGLVGHFKTAELPNPNSTSNFENVTQSVMNGGGGGPLRLEDVVKMHTDV
jgi:hypothetical protein